MTTVRIDKWLWAVRLYKTRSLAIEACRAGHVKLGGASVKPAHDVRLGEVFQVQAAGICRTVRVAGLLERRVGAALVPQYLEDLTPPEEYERQRRAAADGAVERAKGLGRPTKRERRMLESFLGDDG